MNFFINHCVLDDQAQDIAVDMVLQILKTDLMKDFDKKKDIKSILLDLMTHEMCTQTL